MSAFYRNSNTCPKTRLFTLSTPPGMKGTLEVFPRVKSSLAPYLLLGGLIFLNKIRTWLTQ